MCGIGGTLSRSGVQPERVASISRSLRHRGPDDEGFIALAAEGGYESFRGEDTVPELAGLPHWDAVEPGRHRLAMCSRRLSILDLTPAGHQPMVSHDGDLALVFNGEIYNYLELADELESLGWNLKPCGDTTVLLAAFRQWGPACVRRFRGMWAFAVHDRRANRLTLSRDRFGIKPLYYARSDDSIVFASEIKGVLAALPGDPRGSAAAVVRLLTWGSLDHDETTLFEDVASVPAGCNLHVELDDLTVTKEQYYDVGEEEPDPFTGSVDEAIEEYRHRLSESIRLHLRSDVRVGTCLSGGLDSSLIASYAAAGLRNGSLETFTAVYDDPALDERRYVALQAVRDGLMTHEVAPSADHLVRDVDDFLYAQDHPVASTSPYAQWAVMRLAGANGMKVLLDGQGADEAIGGYSYFAGAYLMELLRHGRLAHAIGEARRLRERRGVRVVPQVGRVVFRQLPIDAARRARRHLRIGSELVALQSRSLAGAPPFDAARTYREFCVDALKHSLPQLLRYEDRSSMAFSIESRVPYLDHPLVELVLSLPTGFKYQQGWSKFVQRKAAESRLPGEIVWRRDKLGFATPQRTWQQETRDAVRELVAEVEVPAFLDRRGIENLLSTTSRTASNLSDYWQAVFLLRWMHLLRVRFA